MSVIGFLFLSAGLLLLVLAAVGLFTLPDALSRQHAATKAATLALGLALLGIGFLQLQAAWWWRIAVILALLLATLPVASHMLARAAARRRYRPEELEKARRVD